jgi:hypothetical protein
VPKLAKVDFGALHRVAEQWRGIAVTVAINWLVKPFSARPCRRNVPTRNVGGGRRTPRTRRQDV